jgi:HlyD family secretion protein
MDGERRLFQARRKQREAQKAQLRSRIGQLGREIEGLKAQQAAKGDELALIDIESSRVQHLHDQDLVPETRLLAIRRDRTRIAGEHGTLTAQIARAEGQISEIGLQILNVDQTVQSEAQGELRDIESRIAELMERRIAAEDQLKRVDIKAPIDGIVHELAIYTVGGVISPAETLMLIVPSGDQLTVEVRLSQTDIDQVAIGQPTRLRFAAFNHRTTPELTGTVSRIAADLSRDAQSGQTFYVARVRVDDHALEKLEGLKLMPGMPVEAFIETDERTVLSYIVKPFSDQLMRAMREE